MTHPLIVISWFLIPLLTIVHLVFSGVSITSRSDRHFLLSGALFLGSMSAAWVLPLPTLAVVVVLIVGQLALLYGNLAKFGLVTV